MFQETESNLYIVTGLKQRGLELQVLSSMTFKKQQTVIEIIKSKKDGCVFASRTYRVQRLQNALCALLSLQL